MSDGLVVRGGAGATVVVLEALAAAAHRLLEVAAVLAAVEARLGALLAATAADPGAVLDPLGHLAARGRSAAVLAAPGGPAACAARLALLAARVRAAAAAHRAADAASAAALGGIVLPRTGSRLLLRTATALGSPWLVEARGRPSVTVLPRPGCRAPGGVADLARHVAVVSAAPRGTVQVERVDRADGRRAWVVAVPGTQSWDPVAGPDPFDLTGAVGALAGRRTAGGRLVLAALSAAGARPGEPVLLAGHSQGGMVAAALATDPAVRQRFSVTGVVTFGSPVSTAGVPPAVPVLALENVLDPVPRLDGRPDPVRREWVTAVGLRGGHALEAYVRTAGAVDAAASGADPSLAAARGALGPFLDGPGVRCTRLHVRGLPPEAQPGAQP